MAVKRRVPKKGAVRYWTESGGDHLDVRRGTVVRIAKTNAALRREYKGIIAPPPLLREPHALLRTEWGREVWRPVQELLLHRKEAEKIVIDAMSMMAHARRTSRVDPIW